MSPELDAALHAIEVDFGCLMPDGLRSGGVTPTTKKLRAAIEAEIAAAYERGQREGAEAALRYTEIDGLIVNGREYDLNMDDEMQACLAALFPEEEE